MDPLSNHSGARRPSVRTSLVLEQASDRLPRLYSNRLPDDKAPDNPRATSLQNGIASVARNPALTSQVGINGNMRIATGLPAADVSQQGLRSRFIDQNNGSSSSTASTSYVPLEASDGPNTHGSGHRQKFRIMMDWVNEVERRRPDLDYATQKGWTEHKEKLSKRIRYLESQITYRLRKLGGTSTFENLIPRYPQLSRYLDLDPRRRPPTAASPVVKEEERREIKAQVASSTRRGGPEIKQESPAPTRRQSRYAPQVKAEEIEVIELSD
ncbi:hypothetical protein F5Y13DRAFT_206734 [Hypoxylon sp. FL1857]|nr:hypothetical protein F5Y13DRAFT_206734 [Hypoxylon sp. FL1857]